VAALALILLKAAPGRCAASGLIGRQKPLHPSDLSGLIIYAFLMIELSGLLRNQPVSNVSKSSTISLVSVIASGVRHLVTCGCGPLGPRLGALTSRTFPFSSNSTPWRFDIPLID
jgi:hypothetical protein